MDQFGAPRFGGDVQRAVADQELTGALFDRARHLVIACAVDGNPSAAPLLCVPDGQDLVFLAHRTSRIAAQLAVNPRVQAILRGEDRAGDLALEIGGFCAEVADAAQRRRLIAQLAEAHAALRQVADEDARVPAYACFRLHPARLALVDPLATPRFAWQSLPQNERSDRRLALGDLGAWMRLWVRTARAPFFTAAVVPVLLGGAVAWFAMARGGHQGAWSWPLFLWCLLGAVLAAAGTNLINDYGDHETGADEANEFGANPFTGGSRAIQLGLVAPWKMLVGSVLCFLATIAIGLHLNALSAGSLFAPTPLLAIGVIGCALGVMYTVGPFRLSYRGLGEAAVSLGFGPVIVLGTIDVLARGAHLPVPWLAGFLASLPVAVFVLLILWINQFQDAAADAASGKRTWVVRLAAAADGGMDFALPFRAYLALNAAGFALIALLGLLGLLGRADPALATPFAWLALLPLPLLVIASREGGAWVRRWRDHAQERRRLPFDLLKVNGLTIALHLATGLLLAAGYVLGAAL